MRVWGPPSIDGPSAQKTSARDGIQVIERTGAAGWILAMRDRLKLSDGIVLPSPKIGLLGQHRVQGVIKPFLCGTDHGIIHPATSPSPAPIRMPKGGKTTLPVAAPMAA